jgi:hypothetical protein
LSTKNLQNKCKSIESTTINEMKPPKRQRKQSAKSQMTQGSGPKRQKTSNRQQRQETDSYNVPPVVPRNNTRTVIDIQTHNDGNHRQNDTSMNALCFLFLFGGFISLMVDSNRFKFFAHIFC